MANKDLFEQAIAEAKSVREAAIANAKDALEETLTPHLKDMLAAKLQEMDYSEEDEMEEVLDAVEGMNYDEDDAMEEAEDDSEQSEDEAEQAPKQDESEEEESEEIEAEDEVEGDEDLGDLSVDEFKDLIRDIIAQELGDEGHEQELGADMDGGDIEGMGDEMPSIEEPEELDAEAEDQEIDLDELLAELEADEDEDGDELSPQELANKHSGSPMHKDHDDHLREEEEDIEEGDYKKKKMEEEHDEEKAEMEQDLDEALETINALRHELNEVNILNSKLLYVNRIFKANNLTEQQKVNIIAAFDKAETVKEVKLVYETVSDSVVNARKAQQQIKESKVARKHAALGGASKATGVTAKKPEVISEATDAIRRMQKLAGIIK